jgi:hypothetical protein
MINKHLTFLIVDDVVAMRNAINALLRSLGYINILAAKDGVEALRILKSQPIDVVLSDWEMPVMDGLALLNAVRGDPQLQKLPFLMMSDGTNRQRIKEVIQSGASDFLLKPYTGKDLVSRIEKIVNWKPRDIPIDLKPTDPKKSGRPTILVVDDVPDNLFLLSNLFKDEYRVRAANNGETALAICQSDDPPDLVLLDIMMPSMNGFEVAKRMQDHPASEHIPIIFITAMSNNDARLKGFELGAIDFVAKPINPDVLKPRVRNFMHYVELNKQLQAEYDAMHELARLRGNLKNIIRYDMKEPLAEVIGLIQDLVDEASLNAAQVNKLRIAEEKSLQTLNMVNLSSELYKIETGIFQLDAQPVNIDSILRRIVEIFRSTYAAKQLNLTISAEEIPKSLGDAMLCYSLLNNLLKNACEAAPEKSSVLVSVVNEDPMQIMIQNKGVVHQSMRESFFDKFVAQQKTTDARLGFYSAKLFTEAQNGKIDLKVSEDKNLTTISVSLPRFMEVPV